MDVLGTRLDGRVGYVDGRVGHDPRLRYRLLTLCPTAY